MIRPLSPGMLAAALAISGGISPLAAQSENATATVTYEIREINEISLSGNPAPLVVTTASAGGAPSDAIDETTTWTVTTNQTSRKITGVLDAELPTGLALRITLTPPDGGTSATSVSLSTAAQDLVTGFGSVHAETLDVTYTLSAAPEAGVLPRASRTVTFTILADV